MVCLHCSTSNTAMYIPTCGLGHKLIPGANHLARLGHTRLGSLAVYSASLCSYLPVCVLFKHITGYKPRH